MSCLRMGVQESVSVSVCVCVRVCGCVYEVDSEVRVLRRAHV